jgi:hypothetical protein
MQLVANSRSLRSPAAAGSVGLTPKNMTQVLVGSQL